MEKVQWDCIIVGTGMGAGPLGLELARAGYSVLFVEKGKLPAANPDFQGQFAEQFMDKGPALDVLVNSGRVSESMRDLSRKRTSVFTPFLGSGVGGSSALYGMILERFSADDFKTWPLRYEDFEKYYVRAEELFRVRSSPKMRHPALRALQDDLLKQGFGPYASPLANDPLAECQQCQGYLCKKKCKNDSLKICIEPALEIGRNRVELQTLCEAKRLLYTQGQVTGVQCELDGKSVTLRARFVVLAAGALHSPLLLLNSCSQDYPQGLGNSSGLVGRYLMRHFLDLYPLKIDSDPGNPQTKDFSMSLCDKAGRRLAGVQSFGRLPPVTVLLFEWEDQIRKNHPAVGLVLFRWVKPVVRLFLERILSNRLTLASIMEDSPCFENRVWSEQGTTCVSYRITQSDQKRIAEVRKRLKGLLKPYRPIVIRSAEDNTRLAHACGTCRMGSDPKTSVLDSSNRPHGVKNLFVVDASFFPSSGSTNPALTVAANSLRVADILKRQLEETKGRNR